MDKEIKDFLLYLIKGHWEAQTTNSWDKYYNHQGGVYNTEEEAEKVAEQWADESGDTGTNYYGTFVSDLGEEGIKLKIEEFIKQNEI